jgi:hypothetical protein
MDVVPNGHGEQLRTNSSEFMFAHGIRTKVLGSNLLFYNFLSS